MKRAVREPRVVLAACKFGWPIYIFINNRILKDQKTPQRREHRLAQRRRSRQQKTDERLQRPQTWTDSCDCGIFSLPLYSIQSFFNAERQNTAITMRTKPMNRGRRAELQTPRSEAIRRGSAFLEVCSQTSA